MPPSKSRWIISTATGQDGGKQGAERSIGTAMMEYRNIEFTVVQGIERRVWKWFGVGCGRRDNGQRADPISGGGRSREGYRSGFSSKKRCGSSPRDDQI